MRRRLFGAGSILAVPVSLFVAGWLLPRPEPWIPQSGISPWRMAAIAAVLAVGVAAALVLGRLGRRDTRRPGPATAEPEPVRLLVLGWPLPPPRWRTRTAPGDPSDP
jgi:hypothetical protein